MNERLADLLEVHALATLCKVWTLSYAERERLAELRTKLWATQDPTHSTPEEDPLVSAAAAQLRKGDPPQ